MLDTGSKAHRTSKSLPTHKLIVNLVLSASALPYYVTSYYEPFDTRAPPRTASQSIYST